MASIRKISENSYKITVSCGRTAANKQIRHYMTWTPGQAHDGEADGKGRAESGV